MKKLLNYAVKALSLPFFIGAFLFLLLGCLVAVYLLSRLLLVFALQVLAVC